MIRVLVVALAALFAQVFLAALNQHVGLTQSSILIAPAVIVLASSQFRAVESLSSLLLFGFLLDAWMGAPLGLSMSILALLWGLCLSAILWLGRPDNLLLAAFIFFFSLAFRVVVAIALGVAGGSNGNFGWTQIFVMPLFDLFVGFLFYQIILRSLTLFGLCEIREDASQRLARRSPRIRLE